MIDLRQARLLRFQSGRIFLRAARRARPHAHVTPFRITSVEIEAASGDLFLREDGEVTEPLGIH